MNETLDGQIEEAEEIQVQVIQRQTEDAVDKGNRDFGFDLEGQNFDNTFDVDQEAESGYAVVFIRKAGVDLEGAASIDFHQGDFEVDQHIDADRQHRDINTRTDALNAQFFHKEARIAAHFQLAEVAHFHQTIDVHLETFIAEGDFNLANHDEDITQNQLAAHINPQRKRRDGVFLTHNFAVFIHHQIAIFIRLEAHNRAVNREGVDLELEFTGHAKSGRFGQTHRHGQFEIPQQADAKFVIAGNLDIAQHRSAEQGHTLDLQREGRFDLEDKFGLRQNEAEHAFREEGVGNRNLS